RDGPPPAAGPEAAAYTLACPDEIELAVGPRPDVGGRFAVEPDGAIPVGSAGRLRVDGLTAAEVAGKVATVLAVPRQDVQVRVAEYASRQVFLCGPVAGHERAVPYRGPETVVEFLRRTDGVSREAEPREVHVVRANVAAGRRPEVFPVDLHAILADGDGKTNVRLQPYDQVYVGETARSVWMKYLPPWMQFTSRQQAAGSGQ
ncbi:MAG TPA: polysaccharide biosynthesis/export family protein, partial [Gemmataceae bacterium]